MEKLTNRQFFLLSSSGYMPIHITLKHAFYLRLDPLFTRQTRNGFVYSGEIYELKGSDFIPVLDVDICYSKRCLRVLSLENSDYRMREKYYYVIYRDYSCVFLPQTNYKSLLRYLNICLDSLLIQKII